MSKLIGKLVHVYSTEDAARRKDKSKDLGTFEVLDVKSINWNEHGGGGEGYVVVVYAEANGKLMSADIARCSLALNVAGEAKPTVAPKPVNSKKA